MSAAPAPPAPAVAPAFDHRRLDELMERAGLDALLATSKHNVQYLLGGHRYFFFDYMDAIGVSRYLPVVVYVRGRPEATAYIGNATEDWQLDNRPLWVSRWSCRAGVRSMPSTVLSRTCAGSAPERSPWASSPRSCQPTPTCG
ncbi:aminopeptidase P family N-terminal domain-containing protein [Pseudonocardia benzenivorans]